MGRGPGQAGRGFRLLYNHVFNYFTNNLRFLLLLIIALQSIYMYFTNILHYLRSMFTIIWTERAGQVGASGSGRGPGQAGRGSGAWSGGSWVTVIVQ